MKYIILIAVLIIIVVTKPWEISFAGDIRNSKDSSLLSHFPTTSPIVIPLRPANQVIDNNDSDLPETERFDKIVNRFLAQWEIKGASFALMKDDKLIYSKGYGYADKEAGIETDVCHLFRIASVSKLITAIGIMKLQEEGKLKLSDRVFGMNGILADSIFGNIKDPRSKQITIENLLRHQGGFSVIHGDPMFCPVDVAEKMNVQSPADLNSTIQFVLSRRLRYTPGSTTLYSNIGYGILSKVIEKISGQEYESYIRENVLRPAGCFDLYLGHNLYENKFGNEVRYYEPLNAELIIPCNGKGKLVPKCYGGNNIEGLYGAGGWVASPTELLRLLATIDNDPTIPDILKPESIAYMTAYNKDAMPIGWMSTNEKGDWTRTGTLSGSSALMKKQQDGYSWVFITNTSCWAGSKFPQRINAMITRALETVPAWPERDLFDFQKMDHRQLLVTQ